MADADRISDLGDELLVHIISFLTSPEAAATTVLAKRWKLLFRQTECINFNDEHNTIARMMNHPRRDNVKRCVLSFLNSPIVAADDLMKSIFQNYGGLTDLSVNASPNHYLPRPVLNLTSLVRLHLQGIAVLFEVGFPSLKVLCLRNVTFSMKLYLLFLLRASQVLEDLEIESLTINHTSNKEPPLQSFPMLTKAVLNGNWEYFLPITSLCNAQSIQTTHFLMPPTHHVVNQDFSNLTCLAVSFSENKKKGYLVWLLRCLLYCTILRSLDIHFQLGQGNGEGDWNDEDMEPKKFGIGYGEKVEGWKEEDWKEPEMVPVCLSSCLRRLSFTNFEGTGIEMEFAKYILKNASLLHKLIVHISPVVQLDARQYISNILLAYPRSSNECEVIFIHL